MFCSSCGKPMDAVHLRCPACHHRTSAFWLNLFSLLVLLLAAAAGICFSHFLGPLANLFAGVGATLTPATRLCLSVFSWAYGWWWVVVTLLVVLVAILIWRGSRLPRFFKSGAALAVIAVLALLFVLASMLVILQQIAGITRALGG